MKKTIWTKRNIKQLISYFFVGGTAAIVEWILFFVFSTVCDIPYLIATTVAFIFSTTTNWFLGKTIPFRESTKYEGRVGQEIVSIFFVSSIGLILNIILMYIFVSVIGLNSDIQMTFSKIMATGLVFFWNYLIRKLVVYREKKL